MTSFFQSWMQRIMESKRHRSVGRSQIKTGNSEKATVASRQRRVVVLSQFYRPEATFYPPEIARSLLDRGYEVTVVTGYPNRPGGRLFPGYRQKLGFSELIDGVNVVRVPLIINHSRKAAERIANFLSFSFSALMATNKVRGADAVYVYATPATAAIPAQVWRKAFGIPYVLHVQDLWPESVTDSGMMGDGRISRVAGAVMRPWLKRLYAGADSLIAISSGMRDLLVERGAKADSCSVVYNWANETTITAKSSKSFSEDDVQFLYAGNLGPMQDLESVLKAARQYESHSKFNLTIAGGGILEDALQIQAAEMVRTSLVGTVTKSEVSALYLTSDFQLVTLKDFPIFRTTIPSKFQSSLASGVPVITTVKGDVANLVRRHEAGIVAEPESKESLAAAFDQALSMSAAERARLGRNARRLYESRMSREAGTSAIVSMVDELIQKKEFKNADLPEENGQARLHQDDE